MTALSLQTALEEAGADVAAVAGTLREAMALGEGEFSAAVLDVNLEGEMIYPLAERLIARRVPTIFATGYDVSTTLPDSLRAVPTLQKPVDVAVLVRRLLEATSRAV